MSHVFISYKHGEDTYRDVVVNLLRNEGINYWYDKDLSGGQDWRKEIDEAIDSASVLILILTKAATESPYVTYEWTRAYTLGLQIIPLLFEEHEPANLHPIIKDKQYIHCNPSIDANEIIEEVRRNDSRAFITRMVNRSISLLFDRLNCIMIAIRWCNPILANVDYIPEEADESLASDSEVAEWIRSQVFRKLESEVSLVLNKSLPEYWMSFSPALNGKQRRALQEYALLIENLSDEIIATKEGFQLGGLQLSVTEVSRVDFLGDLLEKKWMALDAKMLPIEHFQGTSKIYKSILNRITDKVLHKRPIREVLDYFQTNAELMYIIDEVGQTSLLEAIEFSIPFACKLAEQNSDALKKF